MIEQNNFTNPKFMQLMFLMFKAMLLFEIYSCLAALGIFVLKIEDPCIFH